MRKRWMIAGAVSALMTGGAIAQEQRLGVFTQALPAPPPGADARGGIMVFNSTTMAAGGNVQFLSAEMGFDGAVVKGAPYSAEAVNETTQTLSDGNRITHKSSSSIYRDGEGRTRREQSLPAIGPWATSGTPEVTVFINDPVSGVNYILESNSKTARKVVAGKFSRGVGMAQPSSIMPGIAFRKQTDIQATATQPNEEKLPTQLIEGVQAEGTRTTVTIPAGQMGNERPIEIVSERWYSPELKTVVMSKHKDPRMGETVYKLTGLQRAEPSRSLFEVPSDYTIADESSPDMLRQKKLLREKMAIDHQE